MSTAEADPKPVDKRPPVIRDLRGAEETPTQRLLRKHIPAWVISGVLNVSLMGSLIAFDSMMGNSGPPPALDAELTVVAEDEQPEAPEPDLTNPDIGLDAELPSVIETTNLDDINVASDILAEDPPGIEESVNMTPIDFNPPAAIGDPSLDPGTLPGENPNALTGTSGGGTGTVNDGSMGRGAATRSLLLNSGGGNDLSEAAVARGLIWLAKQQKTNSGAWQYDGAATHQSRLIASTGMALLPFLAAGQTHKRSKDDKYRKTVEAGLTFLTSQQHPSGQFYNSRTVKNGKVSFSSPCGMYDQAIATVAICEALGMTNDRTGLLRPAQAAVNFIEKAQAADGSWGYSPNAAGDSSIVGWQVQALQSAKLCKDLAVNNAVLKKATEFMISCTTDSLQSKYGYKKGNAPRDTLTAVGLLSRYYLDGWGRRTPGMAAGVQYLLKQHGPMGEMEMYYYYYATQVMHFYEGDEWFKEWNPKMRDRLIKLQDDARGENFGSWNGSGDRWIGETCGRVGMTCMTLLTLEVYYRHLPLYSRDNAGMKELERLK